MYCRLCAYYDDTESTIKHIYTNQVLVAVLQTLEAWELEITPDDELPLGICVECEDNLLKIADFRQRALKAKSYLEDLLEKPPKDKIKLEVQYESDDFNDVDEYSEEGAVESVEIQIVSESEKHNATHTKRRRKGKKCPYCMLKVKERPLYATQVELEEHLRSVHDMERPYNCPHCPATYKSRPGRITHVNSVHLHKTVPCKLCNKEIRGGYGQLRVHIERNHSHGDYTCEICGKEFKNISLDNLNYHKRWHIQEKLHNCKYCEKSFVRSAHLKMHLAVHQRKGTTIQRRNNIKTSNQEFC